MPAPRGHKRYGGRTSGIPNKKTAIRESIMEVFERKGLNPIEAMIEIAQDISVEVAVRLSALKELTQYAFPKKSAVQVTGEMNLELLKQAEEIQALPDVELDRQIIIEAEKIKSKK